MGFLSKTDTGPEASVNPEDLKLAEMIAAARGIVVRDDGQREASIAAVCKEISFQAPRL